MKTLIINGSPRKQGGTALLLAELQQALPGEITAVDTYYANISPCTDCRYCWTHPACAMEDGMRDVYQAIDEADHIVLASPIYFGEVTGSLLQWASRLQYFWASERFRRDGLGLLRAKERKGWAILTDGGGGCMETAFAMAKRLLRIMGAPCQELVYFSGADQTDFAADHSLYDLAKASGRLEEIRRMAERMRQ